MDRDLRGTHTGRESESTIPRVETEKESKRALQSIQTGRTAADTLHGTQTGRGTISKPGLAQTDDRKPTKSDRDGRPDPPDSSTDNKAEAITSREPEVDRSIQTGSDRRQTRPSGRDLAELKRKRQSINRGRADYWSKNADEFEEKFMGESCCEDCGDEPKHSNPAACAVHYYRTHGRLPKQYTLPCLYCDSPAHTTDACPFLHEICKKCNHRGHAAFECHRRTTLEWLIAFLDCVHLGKLTRENVSGPIEGRYGFGDVSRIQVPGYVWEMVRFKANSMHRFRKKNLPGHGGFNPIKEAGLSWALCHENARAVDQERAQLDRDRESFESEVQHYRNKKLGRTVGTQTE